MNDVGEAYIKGSTTYMYTSTSNENNNVPSNDVVYEVTTYNNAWLVEATIENHRKLLRSNLISSNLFFIAFASMLMLGRKAMDI